MRAQYCGSLRAENAPGIHRRHRSIRAGGRGYDHGSGTTALVDVYDAAEDLWDVTSLASNVGRQQGAATVGGGMALFGGGIVGGGSGSETDVVDIYDSTVGPPTDSNAWSVTNLSAPRRTLSAAFIDHWALFAGGQSPGHFHSRVDIYDTETGQWSQMTLPGGGRAGMAATTVGPYVMFSGGANYSNTQTTVDVYDSNLGGPSDPGAWYSLSPLAIPRWSHSAVTVGTKALFAGGSTNTGTSDKTDTVEVYDLAVGPPSDPAAWSTMNLSVSRQNMMATASGNLAFFGGGVAGASSVVVDTVDVYNDETDTWSTCTLSIARASGGAASSEGKVVLAGGFSGTTFSTMAEGVVDIFNVSSDLEVGVELSLHPRTLKLTSNGNYVTGYVSAPPGVSIVDLVGGSTSITEVNGAAVSVLVCLRSEFQDQDEDGQVETLMVKFDRASVAALLVPGENSIAVTGLTVDGEIFTGSDSIQAR